MKVYLDKPRPLIVRAGNESKVISFDLERDGTRARLLGMVHLAERRFFDRRNADIEAEPNRIVFEEGSPADESREPSALASAIQASNRSMLKALGGDFAYQTQVFPANRSEVYSVDLSMEQIDQLLREDPVWGTFVTRLEALAASQKGTFPSLEEDNYPPVPDEIYEFFRLNLKGHLATFFESEPLFADLLKRHSPLEKVLIKKRNEVLAGAINSVPAYHPTVMVPWGVAHFPDLVRRLYPEGWNYVPGSVKYTPYMTVPTFMEKVVAGWEAGKALVGAAPALMTYAKKQIESY